MFVWFCVWWLVLTVACLCVGRWISRWAKRQRRHAEWNIRHTWKTENGRLVMHSMEAIPASTQSVLAHAARYGVTCEEAVQALHTMARIERAKR